MRLITFRQSLRPLSDQFFKWKEIFPNDFFFLHRFHRVRERVNWMRSVRYFCQWRARHTRFWLLCVHIAFIDGAVAFLRTHTNAAIVLFIYHIYIYISFVHVHEVALQYHLNTASRNVCARWTVDRWMCRGTFIACSSSGRTWMNIIIWIERTTERVERHTR